MIKIKWFGHSMWKIWNKDISIVTDPFDFIGYPLPAGLSANIVTSSHDHGDHNNFSLISGSPQIVSSEGEFELSGIKIRAFHSWHDNQQGKRAGSNLLVRFELEGKTFLHCGDLGHDLTMELLTKLGQIDVLFIPVGGYYTIDAVKARNVVEKINPEIVFPMHYKTDVLDYPIATEEEYLKLITDYRRIDSNQIELTENDFTGKQTILLNYKSS